MIAYGVTLNLSPARASAPDLAYRRTSKIALTASNLSTPSSSEEIMCHQGGGLPREKLSVGAAALPQNMTSVVGSVSVNVSITSEPIESEFRFWYRWCFLTPRGHKCEPEHTMRDLLAANLPTNWRADHNWWAAAPTTSSWHIPARGARFVAAQLVALAGIVSGPVVRGQFVTIECELSINLIN